MPLSEAITFWFPPAVAGKPLTIEDYDFHYYIYEIINIPKYLNDIYEYLKYKQTNPDLALKFINRTPTGTNYGFRQALILMAINDYTSKEAEIKIKELLPYLEKYLLK